jgi:murein DD-endopeptidase MepM/ murein hydrolase activator NlpD
VPGGDTNDGIDSDVGGTDGADRAIVPSGSLLSDGDVAQIDGPFTADGVLVKPSAVDTSVADGKDLLRTYRVRSGDTLVGIASHFKVSMMTLWWANHLGSKDHLRIGQVIKIPPTDGLVVTVSTTDTLDALAARYDVQASDILTANGLQDPNLIVGQTLTIPGARGAQIPVPKPKAPPAATSHPTRTTTHSSRGGGTSSPPPSRYTGGRFAWPVPGGYISQYFHYGHYAIDIAADMGSRVLAAASGTVIFAGWKNNGGGYQVWISHGSNLYTTYNHMSSITVGRGQSVGRGQQVGRVGMTGNATGPHCHFEVWIGPIWDGGTRVNPLLYL